MAKTNQVAICPGCNSELPVPVPEACPFCKRVLRAAESRFFGAPDYLYLQRGALLVEQLETAKLKPGDPVHEKRAREIEGSLVDYLRSCPAEDRIAALIDAKLVLEHLVHSRTSVSELRQITTLARAIGNLGAAIEQYFRSGGSAYDREIGLLRPDQRSDSWGEASPDERGDRP